jgi:hypothetical protein
MSAGRPHGSPHTRACHFGQFAGVTPIREIPDTDSGLDCAPVKGIPPRLFIHNASMHKVAETIAFMKAAATLAVPQMRSPVDDFSADDLPRDLWRQATFLYTDAHARSCARRLKALYPGPSTVAPFPKGITNASDVIELWVPE